MTPEQFCYWLQGRVELLPEQVPSAEEWAVIRGQLTKVYKKEESGIEYYRRIFGQPQAPQPQYWQPVYVESPILPYTVTC